MKTRIEFVACALVATLALSSACSGEADEPEPTSSAPAEAAIDPCTKVINDRDSEAFEAARTAAFEVAAAVVEEKAPSETELETWRESLQTGRDHAAAELEQLSSARSEPEWQDALAPLSSLIARYEARIAATESWPPERADLGSEDDETATVEALTALGLNGRDCEVLATDPGPAVESREFVSQAAVACSTIVARRRDEHYLETLKVNLAILQAVHGEKEVDPTQEQIDAVRAVQAEWTSTAADLATVDATPTDSTAWRQTLKLADDRVKLYTNRLEALESGEAGRIAAAYDGSAIGEPGWDWGPLGLQHRDCRSVEA